jgi:hypothetical protein
VIFTDYSEKIFMRKTELIPFNVILIVSLFFSSEFSFAVSRSRCNNLLTLGIGNKVITQNKGSIKSISPTTSEQTTTFRGSSLNQVRQAAANTPLENFVVSPSLASRFFRTVDSETGDVTIRDRRTKGKFATVELQARQNPTDPKAVDFKDRITSNAPDLLKTIIKAGHFVLTRPSDAVHDTLLTLKPSQEVVPPGDREDSQALQIPSNASPPGQANYQLKDAERSPPAVQKTTRDTKASTQKSGETPTSVAPAKYRGASGQLRRQARDTQIIANENAVTGAVVDAYTPLLNSLSGVKYKPEQYQVYNPKTDRAEKILKSFKTAVQIEQLTYNEGFEYIFDALAPFWKRTAMSEFDHTIYFRGHDFVSHTPFVVALRRHDILEILKKYDRDPQTQRGALFAFFELNKHFAGDVPNAIKAGDQYLLDQLVEKLAKKGGLGRQIISEKDFKKYDELNLPGPSSFDAFYDNWKSQGSGAIQGRVYHAVFNRPRKYDSGEAMLNGYGEQKYEQSYLNQEDVRKFYRPGIPAALFKAYLLSTLEIHGEEWIYRRGEVGIEQMFLTNLKNATSDLRGKK